MICLDNKFDKVETTALNVLTDVMKSFAIELAKEIKNNAEVGGRSQPNLIDALNASFDFNSEKEEKIKHITNSRLSKTLVPIQ